MIVNPAKTAEQIEMSFELWTQVDSRNHELDGVQIPPGEGAILRGKRQSIVEYREYSPCAAALTPFVHYFDHLLPLINDLDTSFVLSS